jgi:pimeloyl-ACP methyl ester carboxylesterase
MKKISFILCSWLYICTSCNNQSTTEDSAKKSGTIQAGGFQVYYEREGKGEPILLLHAGLQDHTMWKDQVGELSKHYTVITIDQPFHGNTIGNDTVTLVSDIIHTVLDNLNIDKVSVIGLSMGAGSALDFVIANPEHVSKCILISSGVNGYERDHKIDSSTFAWYPQLMMAMNAGDTVEAAKIFTRVWAEGPYRTADSLRSPASQYVFTTTLENLKKHKLMGWPTLQKNPPAIDKLSSIKVPVLIIHGDKDIPYMMESNMFLEKNIPGAKRVLVKDVAHMLNIEKPAEVNKRIMDFINEGAVKK